MITIIDSANNKRTGRTIILDPTFTLSEDPTGLPKIRVVGVLDGIYPEVFGALGDGVTDDTIAINAAAVAATNSLLIFQPHHVYRITGAVTFFGDVEGNEATLLQTTSNVGGVILGASGIDMRNLVIIGPQFALQHTNENAIVCTGASAASPWDNIKIRRVDVSNWGMRAIWLKWVTNFEVSDSYLHDLYYAGVIGTSALHGRVSRNRIKHLVGNPLCYGVTMTRTETNSLVTDPRSEDVLIDGNFVEDVFWTGLDTHGGRNIRFIKNALRNIQNIGILAGGSDDAGGVTQWAPLDFEIIDNWLDSEFAGTADIGIVVHGAGAITGTNVELATGKVHGNTVIQFGNDANGNSGGIEVERTLGVSVNNNRLRECSPNAIVIFHDNYELECIGNKSTDVWSNAQAAASVINVRSNFNTGKISENSAARGAKTAAVVNTNLIRIAGTSNIDLSIWANDGTACTAASSGFTNATHRGFRATGAVQLDGDTIVGTDSGATLRDFTINAAAGQQRQMSFRSGGSSRWIFEVDGLAESGSDAGSDFNLFARTDTGAVIDTPIGIVRAAGGKITFSRPLKLSTAVSKLIQGATSWALRNAADALDNLLVDNATGNLTVRGSVTATTLSIGSLTLTDAASKIIPGVTSLSMRNHADSADNILILDNGDTTFRTVIKFATAASRIIPGATSLSLRDNANANDNFIITDAGVATIRAGLTVTAGGLTVTAGGATITAGALTFGTAVSKIVPGATSLSLRNTADSADNILIANSGDVTFRTLIKFATAASKIIPGATSISLRNNADSQDNLIILDSGTATFLGSTTVTLDLNIGVNAGSAVGLNINSAAANIRQVRFQTAGVARWLLVTTATAESGGNAGSDFEIRARDDAGAAIDTPFAIPRVAGSAIALNRPLSLLPAASKIIPGATSLSLRNNADSADNILISNAGLVTVRAGLTITAAELTFGTAASRIIPGATSISLRNNANSADNLIITDAGGLTIRGQLTSTVSTGTAPAVVASTTKVTNLNADLLDGLDSTAFMLAGSAIGGSGTIGTIPKFSAATTLVDSILTEAAGVVTVAGDLTTGTNTGGAVNLTINSAVALIRQFRFQTAGVNRWLLVTTAIAESGGNVGSDFEIRARDDAGAAIDTPMSIPRVAGGIISFARNLSLTTAVSKIVSGATSLSLRNNADSADNILITNAGVVTVRAGLTVTAGGLTVTAGGATITAGSLTFGTAASKIVPGATSLSLRNNADSADNILIADAGDVTLRTILKFATAVSKIIPGATSISLRNNADAADNLIITDAGVATIRAGLTITAGGLTVTAGGATITAGTLAFGAAASRIVPGVTSISLRDNANANDNFILTDAGVGTIRAGLTITAGGLTVTAGGATITAGALTFGAAASRIIPGATSISLRDTANANDNLLMTDAGVATIRAGLTITAGGLTVTAGGATITAGSLTFGTAASKIVPGATSLSLRNNADSADNILITNAGVVTVRAGLTITAGGVTITAGSLTLGTAASKIVPGATSLSFRNNADSADNLIILDAGAATFRGSLDVPGNLTNGTDAGTTRQFTINAAAGNLRTISWQTAGLARWLMRTNSTAEGGADAGSNFELLARTDAGGGIDTVIAIVRAAGGTITFSRDLVLNTAGRMDSTVAPTAEQIWRFDAGTPNKWTVQNASGTPSGMPLKRIGYGWYAPGAGTVQQFNNLPATPTVTATAALAAAVDNYYTSYTTSAVNGNQSGVVTSTFTITRMNFNPIIYIRIRTPAAFNSGRCWLGLTSISQTANSDTATGSCAMFRMNAGTLIGVMRDGTTQSVTATISTLSTSTSYLLKIRITGQNTANFSVDGGAETALATNPPATTTDLGIQVNATCTAAAAAAISVAYMQGEHGR